MGGNVEKVLEALQDERVKAAIRRIVMGSPEQDSGIRTVLPEKAGRETARLSEQLKRSEQAKDRLADSLRKREYECNRLEELLKQKEREKAELEERLQASEKQSRQAVAVLKEAQQQMEFYQKSYQGLDAIYRSYLGLDQGIQQELSRVLSTESAELFLVWGSQWNNLEALWDFMSYRFHLLDEESRVCLNEVFDYLFELYRKVNPTYQRLEVKIGDEFDEDIHIRSANSRVGGRISKVLLCGYRNVNTGKLKKSIVII